MLKKMVAVILTCALSAGMSVNTFAYSEKQNSEDMTDFTLCSVEQELVYVDDGSGNMIEVLLEERTYVPNSGDIATADYVAEYPVGTRKQYTATITNEQLGLPWSAGSLLSGAGKKVLSKLAGEAIEKKLASTLIPGVNLVARIAAGIALINGVVFGNEGFKVTVTLEYDEYVSQREGYSIFGWDFRDVSLKTY